jgi:putative ABC transport system substrate-binding protein
MNRRSFLAIATGALAAPLAGEAQQTGKVYRIGYLEEGSAGLGYGWLRQGLRDLGWIEGENLVIEARSTEGQRERLGALVADLIRLNVDAIVASDTPTAMAAKQATKTVPIVMISGDPVAAGLVTSLAKPGGNVTGIATQGVEVRARAIQTLLEAVPGILEIGYLVKPDNPGVVQGWQEVQVVAPRLGVKLRRFDVSQRADLERAIAMMARERIGAMVVPADALFASHRSLIGALREEPASVVVRISRVRGSWSADVLRPGSSRTLAARRLVRRPDSQGGQARRPAGGAPHEVSSGHQHQDRQGPRPHDPAVVAAAGGPGDRVARMKTRLLPVARRHTFA